MANFSYTKVNVSELNDLANSIKSVKNNLASDLEEYRHNLNSISSNGYLQGIANETIDIAYNRITSLVNDFIEYADTVNAKIKEIVSSTEAIENEEQKKEEDIYSKDPLTYNENAKATNSNTATTVIDTNLASSLDQKFEPGFSAKVEEVAKNLNCDPNDLLAIMYSECGLNPNHIEKSTRAVGLIQFMPATAKSLGYTTEEIANMSATDQLDLVEKYVKNCNYYNKDQELDAGTLYSIMFLPGRANKDVLATKGESYYNYNAGLDLNKDGVITKQDLANRLDQKYDEMSNEYLK